MAENLNIAKNRKLEYKLLIDTPEGLFDAADYLTDLEIERGDTSRIGTGQSGTDNTVATMNFTLHNDGRVGGTERVNFSPRDEDSPMNNWNGEYNPLLFPNVEVIFQLKIQNFKTELIEYVESFYFYNGEHEVDAESEIDGEEEVDAESDGIEWLNELFGQNAETGSKYAFENEPIEDAVDVFEKGQPLNPDDYEINYEDKIVNIWLNSSLGQNDISAFYYFGNDDWITMFQGFLGDDIRVSAHEVTCEMRDLAKPMQDKLVEELQEYGDTDNPPTAEEVIREIMDENGYEDYPFDPDEDSDGSGFSITEYQVEYMSVWQAIQEIAAERGWFLGFRWDTDEGEYRLKFLEPDRGMDVDNADYEIDWATDFYDDEYNLSDKDIRNACKVVYRNRDSGEIENITYEDQESIDTYGRKFMQFEEEDTSLIDTEEEAEQLAEAAVKDLRELPAGQDVTLPICPELDVLMGVNINDPRLSSTKDFVGIESVRHSFTFGDNPSYETTIIGSGYISGGHKKWIDRDARSGVKKPIDVDTVKNQIVGNSITVAAHNSSLRGRRGADYVCKGESDQVTINKAIDSVERGGAVVLLEGEYIVDDEIQIKTEIDLRGQGGSTKIIVSEDIEVNFDVIINPDTAESIAIEKINIDGNKGNYDSIRRVWGIRLEDAENADIKDCKIFDCPESGIALINSNVTINNVRSINNDGYGLNVEGFSGKINGCSFQDNGSEGILFVESDANIIDNNIDNNGAYGIRLVGVTNSLIIDDNYIADNEEDGIWVGGISTDVKINGNDFRNNSQSGNEDYDHIRLRAGTSTNSIRKYVIEDNTFRSSGDTKPAGCIYLDAHDGGTIDDTFINGNDFLDGAGDYAIKETDDVTGTSIIGGNRGLDGDEITNPDG